MVNEYTDRDSFADEFFSGRKKLYQRDGSRPREEITEWHYKLEFEETSVFFFSGNLQFNIQTNQSLKKYTKNICLLSFSTNVGIIFARFN